MSSGVYAPRYIAAWPYAEADPGQRVSYNALHAAFRISRLRIVSMDVPRGVADEVAETTFAQLLFYRIRPYSAQTPCRVGVAPLVVAKWVSGGGFDGDPAPPLFPQRPLSKLRGCPLNVAIRQYAPFMSIHPAAEAPQAPQGTSSPSSNESSTALWEARGQWVPLLRALELGMNARFVLRPMSPEEYVPSWNGSRRFVVLPYLLAKLLTLVRISSKSSFSGWRPPTCT